MDSVSFVSAWGNHALPHVVLCKCRFQTIILVSESCFNTLCPCAISTSGFWKRTSSLCFLKCFLLSLLDGLLFLIMSEYMSGIFLSVFLTMWHDGWCCFLVCHQIIWNALFCCLLGWQIVILFFLILKNVSVEIYILLCLNGTRSWFAVQPKSYVVGFNEMYKWRFSMQWARVRGSLGLCNQQCVLLVCCSLKMDLQRLKEDLQFSLVLYVVSVLQRSEWPKPVGSG